MNLYAFALTAALALPAGLAAQSTLSVKHSPGAEHDRLFLHTLASEDQSEIHLAKLALNKSNNPQVKLYAQSKILAADPKMEQDAKQLADKINLGITTEPNGAKRTRYQTLSHLSGTRFDQVYAKYEKHQQQADLIAVENETVTAANSQVRAFALKEETPVREAAQAAKQLAQSLHAK